MERLTTASLVSERALQHALTDAAHWLGWLSYHTYDSRRCSAGFPDLVLVHPGTPGQLLFVEAKSAKGRLRREQIIWIEALRNAGQEVRIWRPCDLDEAIARLQRH